MPSFGVPPWAFVAFIENHDQIANTGDGKRLRFQTSPARYRAMTALLAARAVDADALPGAGVRRVGGFSLLQRHGPRPARPDPQGPGGGPQNLPVVRQHGDAGRLLADPFAPETFTRCKLDFSEREKHAAIHALHRDLLRLRREDQTFAAQRPGGVDGAVLGPHAFVLRFFWREAGRGRRPPAGGQLRVIAGTLARARTAAGPAGGIERWETLWTSELPLYGGYGPAAVETEDGRWRLPAEAAVALRPAPEA